MGISKSNLALLRKQRLYEQKVYKSREKYILDVYIDFAKEIESQFLKDDDFMKKIDKIIKEKFNPQMTLAINKIAKLNIEQFTSYFMNVFKRNINLEELQVIKSEMLDKFLKKYTAESVKNISGTTKKIINNRLTTYTQQGLNSKDVVKNIVEDTKGVIGKSRARIIARTETSKAISITNYTTAEKAGFKYKTWIYTNGSVTKRLYHQSMNDKKIKINEKFKVGGADGVPSVTMRFPKDPECRVPGQIISCSCLIFYS